ncbi:MAG: efflux RND transporter periplasmic adaptor subunit [bacterium]|nr:efflux RND transporter periplasmic adaptor subunit [bacterium]
MAQRSRKFWIWAVFVVIAVGGVAAYATSRRPPAPLYDLATAVRRDVVREVSVTGRVKAATEVALAFDVSGRVVRAPAAVGNHVIAGSELVALDAAGLHAEQRQRLAQLAQARAELAGLKAGMRPEEIRIAESDVENAARALADAERTLRETEVKATVDLDGKERAVPNILRDAYAKADDAVRKQTDELFTNDATESPQIAFQTSDYQAAIDAERGRRAMEEFLRNMASSIELLPADGVGRNTALERTATQLLDVSRFLERVIAAVNGATNLGQATIATYKTNVNIGRTNVNAARTAIEDLRQAIAAQGAVNGTAIAGATASVTTVRNTLAAAEAKLALARAGATPEQIQAAEAQVAAAAANVASTDAALAKTVLRAPFSGVVTQQDARMGAAVTLGTVMVRLMSDTGFEIEVHLPEVDLPGIMVGSGASVTLDAYGSSEEFIASVIAIDPAATLVEGVPTYRTTLTLLAEDDRIRAGMTANVTIVAGERRGVVVVPQRAVGTRNGETIVRILRDGAAVEVPVRLGLRGSDGYVEIIEGLEEGLSVIRSEREQK